MSFVVKSAGFSLPSIDRLQFLAGLEADGLARRNRNFGAGARIASDAGLARAHVEHAKSAQFNAVAGESAFFMLSKTVSTASSALVLVIPVRLTTSLMISSLITGVSRILVRIVILKLLMLREIAEIVNGGHSRKMTAPAEQFVIGDL